MKCTAESSSQIRRRRSRGRRGPANGVSHIINFAPAPGGGRAGAGWGGPGRANCYNYHATDTYTDFMRRGHASTQHSPTTTSPAWRQFTFLFIRNFLWTFSALGWFYVWDTFQYDASIVLNKTKYIYSMWYDISKINCINIIQILNHRIECTFPPATVAVLSGGTEPSQATCCSKSQPVQRQRFTLCVHWQTDWNTNANIIF